MKVLLTTTLILICLLGFSLAFNSLVTPRAACKADPKPCLTAGPLCDTCSNLVTCVESGEGTFIKDQVQKCALHENCIKGQCIDENLNTTAFCDGTACLDFPCNAVGIFPHPFYCNRFVLCVQIGSLLKEYENECPHGWGYTVEDCRCNTPLDPIAGCDGLADFPVPPCGYAGQVGSVNGSDYLYYVCQQYSVAHKVLYPMIFACPPGLTTNGQGCA